MSNEPVPAPKTEPAPASAVDTTSNSSNSSGPVIAKDNKIANGAKIALGVVGVAAAVVGVAAFAGIIAAASPLVIGLGVAGVLAGGISAGINYLQDNKKEMWLDLAGAALGVVGVLGALKVLKIPRLIDGIMAIGGLGLAFYGLFGGNEKTGADKVTPPSDAPPNPTPDNGRKQDALGGKPKVIEMEPLYITVKKPKVIEMEPVYITVPKPTVIEMDPLYITVKKAPKTPKKSETPAPNINQCAYHRSKSAVVRLPASRLSRKNTS